MKHAKNLVLGACTTFTLAACSSNPATNYSALGYQSNYNVSTNQVNQYNVQRIAQAPQRKVVMMEFNRPSAEIFMPLLTQVHLYSEDVVKVEFDHSQSQNSGTFGVGSVRICTFKNGDKLYEPLKVYEAGRYYAYTVDKVRSTKALPIDDVLLFYSFEDRVQRAFNIFSFYSNTREPDFHHNIGYFLSCLFSCLRKLLIPY